MEKSMNTQHKVALFGNVNTEEVFARRLIGEGVVVDGYLLFPNDAFASFCRKVDVLSQHENLDKYLQTVLPNLLKNEGYDAILLGPDFMVGLMSQILRRENIQHVGATPAQLTFETDKSQIHEVFPPKTGILPKGVVLNSADAKYLHTTLAKFPKGFVLKFVGDYSSKYSGSPVGRVRFSGETIHGFEEVREFVENSISTSGKCIIEEKLTGQEFSSNYAVDINGNFFRLGENVCFKRRNNGNTGPICDGTGSITVANTLPFLSEADIRFVEDQVVRPFHQHVGQKSGAALCALLNLDLMKTDDGRIVLFEVNVREPGGHSSANILSGLKTSFFDVIYHTQRGSLCELTPEFTGKASIVVSAYPSYFPEGVADDNQLQETTVTKVIPTDVKLYTGWVDLLEDTNEFRRLRMRNSPTLLFEYTDESLAKARKRLYAIMKDVVPKELDYRTDIGT
jgi:phosphoribosylamine-glycine ligase